MISLFRKILYPLALLLFISACSSRQPEEPNPVRRKSPTAISNLKHQDTYIKITYGQPYKNEREVFGDLVPYGKVWRTGANEATELTTTKPVWINGNRLESGTYSIFSIPGPQEWVIIFNSELGQWGSFEYDSTKDVLRTKVPATKTQQVTEALTIRFEKVRNDSTSMIFKWDRTAVYVPLEFERSKPLNS